MKRFDWDFLIKVGLIVLSLAIWGWLFLNVWRNIYLLHKNPTETSLGREDNEIIRYSELIIESGFLRAYPNPVYFQPQILGTLMGDIIRCESGGDSNAKNPHSTAYGLCQFIDSTWNYVQRKWGMKLDRTNPEDQIYACERLLQEEGSIHWIQSAFCWNKGQ